MRARITLLALFVAGTCLSMPGASRAAASMPDPSIAVSDSVDSLYAQAGDLYARQRYREAIPLFQRVVELDPHHGNAYALLGGSYLQLGDYPRAINAFERALELDEGIKLAYLGLVAANYFSERMEAAQEWVNRMIPILTGEERARYLATISNQFPLLDVSNGVASGGS